MYQMAVRRCRRPFFLVCGKLTMAPEFAVSCAFRGYHAAFAVCAGRFSIIGGLLHDRSGRTSIAARSG